MVDRDLLADRVQRLREIRHLLGRWEHSQLEELDDPFTKAAVERWLQLAAQVMIDVGAHLVASHALGTVEDYRSVFRVLGRTGKLGDLDAFVQSPRKSSLADSGRAAA